MIRPVHDVDRHGVGIIEDELLAKDGLEVEVSMAGVLENADG